ncbi:TetR family transcriptional regulator C-terminal domain-containing protein [Streptomyces sp. M2CJ-2]|uniref:TetR/AcrR family transcriptional regulator n=1 Tax=Streptomyces sp. M2CJ-2 TaxID=2803948 RepID=UPI001927905C|nr:TetR family transcriptional regulator C-terminal domain-containing protein [Streptomyces sp. M2CJ-2]MBL3669492.1 TetR family transcriptional regulator C-terminal domain-containing protein [Streptomyces sp. M2CJ-2]
MTSRGPEKRVRKAPAERRSEMVTAAARVGLAEGLECVTLRRVADELGVRPGLVGHYFPAADRLVAEAFTSATGAELDSLLPELPADPGPGGAVRALRRLFSLTSSADFDDVSRLWLNARHLARYRPVLREHVVEQDLLWCRRIERVVAAGVAAGDFRCADPWAAAVRIHVAIDGTSAYVNTGVGHRAAPIADMARTFAEAELGLASGTLGPR